MRTRAVAGLLASTLLALVLTLVLALATAAGASAARTPAVQLWSQAIRSTAVPAVGCFHASYPRVAWLRVHCAPHPNPRDHESPRGASVPPQAPTGSALQSPREPEGLPIVPFVGGGHGGVYSAEVAAGTITSAVGSVPSVSPGASEEDEACPETGPCSFTPEKFSLQLNANTFSGATECGSIAGCEGWEQFIYSSSLNEVFIEFWLINHQKPKEGNKCPGGWSWLGPQTEPSLEYLEADCNLKSEMTSLSGGALKVSGLTGATLEGKANSGGLDSVVLVTGGGSATATGAANLLHLDKGWKIAEFAVIGDFNGTKADFSPKTTLTVNTAIRPSTLTDATPRCLNTGFTAESNNLTAEATPALSTQLLPTISTQQTNGTATLPATCATYGISPPSVSITTPSSGGNYSYGQLVDAVYSCSPAPGATLKSCSGTVPNGSRIDTTSATNLSFAVTAEDTDGQRQSLSHTYSVAPAPPTAKISEPSAGGTYALEQLVLTKFSCAEGGLGPGLESCDDSNGTETLSGGAGTLETRALGPHTYTVSATSRNGKAGTASIGYTVAAPPVATIKTPPGGGIYIQGEVIATTFSCAEGEYGTGLSSCEDSGKASGGSGTIDTSELGEHEYTVTARSKDGQIGEARIKYVVGLPCRTAAGYGQYIKATEPHALLQVWANLSTNLAVAQELRVNGQDGAARFALISLSYARCVIVGSTATFTGEGRASEPVAGRKLGWTVRFALTVGAGGASFTGTLRNGEGAVIHEISSPFLSYTMKIRQ